MTERHVGSVCSSSSVSEGNKQRYCPWMKVSQNVLASAGMLRAALRSYSTVHLIHKQLPLQQMPLQCATVGFGSLEESTAGFAETDKVLVCVGCQLCVSSPPPPHSMQNNLRMALLAMSCWGFPHEEWLLENILPCHLEVYAKDPLAICKVWEVTKPLQGVFAHCKEQWGFTPELGHQAVWAVNLPPSSSKQEGTCCGTFCKLLVVSGLMPRSSFLNYWSKSRLMQHSPSTLCNPWRKNLNDSNFWSCKCCWDRQALLGLCVWLHSCSQTAGISLGMLPLARQVLSSSRLSLTHTASPKGWDLPAFRQHCTICCTILCSSRAQYYWPSISRTELDQQPCLTLSLTLAGQRHSSLCPQQALNPAFYCTPVYLLLIFCLFQNFSRGYLLIFQYKECRVKW